MMAVDTNVLVYAHRREARLHREASALVRRMAEGRTDWAIPWPCLYEFFSVVTNPRIWKDAASSPEQAKDQIRSWAVSPKVRLISETGDFLDTLERFVARPRVRGPIVHDARIAAVCVAHGVDALITRDRDFALFPELRTHDPFEP